METNKLPQENSSEQAREFLRTMLTQVTKKKEVHDAKKAAKDLEYDNFVTAWQEHSDEIQNEVRRIADAIAILEPNLPANKPRKDHFIRDGRGRKPVMCHEFHATLVKWHTQINRVYSRDEFYDFFKAHATKNFNKHDIGKRIHAYVRLGNLFSVRFNNHRLSYFGPPSWFNIKSEFDIEIKPKYDYPLVSAPHGIRLPMVVRGLKNMKKKPKWIDQVE